MTMGASRRALLTAGLGLPLATLVGCSDATGASEEDGYAVGDGTYTRIPVDKRSTVPQLAGTTLDGKKIALSDYKGTVVVLNVWGSWCPPCRAEASELVKAATRTKGKAQFIGLNTRDLDQAQAKAFVRSFKINFPNIYDPDGKLLLAFGAVPAKAIPSTIIVDREGRIAGRILGPTTASTLVGSVEDIAAGK